MIKSLLPFIKIDKDIRWIMASMVAQMTLNTLLIKFLTTKCTLAQYGTLSLFNATLQFWFVIFFASYNQTATTYAYRFPTIKRAFTFFSHTIYTTYCAVLLVGFLGCIVINYFTSENYTVFVGWLLLIGYCESQQEYLKAQFYILKNRKVITLNIVISYVVRVLFTIIGWQYYHDLTMVWLAWTLGSLAGLIYLKQRYTFLLFTPNNDGITLIDEPFVFKLCQYLVAVNFFAWIQVWLDRWIITHYQSSAQAGLYSSFSQIAIHPFSVLSGLLMSYFGPNLYRDYAQNATLKTFQHTKRKVFICYITLSSIGLILLFFFKNFVLMFFVGKQFQQESNLFLWVTLGWMIFQLSQLQTFMMNIMGDAKRLLIPNIIVGIISIISNIILIPIFGVYGIAFSFIIVGCLKFFILVGIKY